MIQFLIPEKPKGKDRQRQGRGHMYTPKQTVEYEKLVRECCKEYEGAFGESPVKVTIISMYPIPKSKPKYIQEKMECHEIYPTVKPDADNVAKIILDAMNGFIYKDDSQVCDLRVVKGYHRKPGVVVRVEKMNDIEAFVGGNCEGI